MQLEFNKNKHIIIVIFIYKESSPIKKSSQTKNSILEYLMLMGTTKELSFTSRRRKEKLIN